jgi:hypothetical protein
VDVTHETCDHVKTLTDYKIKVAQLKALWIDLIGKPSIKPYFHVLEHHVPAMISSEDNPFKTLAVFSTSAMELKHKLQTLIQYRATNQHHPCKSIVESELVGLWLSCNADLDTTEESITKRFIHVNKN